MTPKVLFFCLPGIGDALMATPLIHLVKQHRPDAEIHIACMFGAVQDLFEKNTDVTQVHRLSLYGGNRAQGLSQTLALRKLNFDTSFLTFPAFRREYHIIQRLVGASQRIAHRFDQGYWRECHFFATDLVPVDYDAHNVVNDLNLAQALGVDWKKTLKREEIRYRFPLDQKFVDFGLKYFQTIGFEKEATVAIHPGSTASPAGLSKRWPKDRFVQLVRRLIHELGKKVLIFVGPDELNLGEEIQAAIDPKDKCHLVKNLSFKEAVGILSHARLLVTNDNGFGHVAVSQGVKTVSLMGVTDDRWTLPFAPQLATSVRSQPYRPWHRYELKRSVPEEGFDGMNHIATERVYETLEASLS